MLVYAAVTISIWYRSLHKSLVHLQTDVAPGSQIKSVKETQCDLTLAVVHVINVMGNLNNRINEHGKNKTAKLKSCSNAARTLC